MLIQGCYGKERTNILIKNYLELIKNGVIPSCILFLVLNSYKKLRIIEELKTLMPEISEKDLKVYTPAGLCYNALLDNWKYISKVAGNPDEAKPNLCGLEVSQYIFKQCIKEADFSDYISKVNLLHQLFRRYSLIVQNDLSIKEVIEKSKILKESFYKDAQKAIDSYKKKTIELNSFDYLRQMAVFPLIYKNTNYFKSYKYLFVDDGDEFSYLMWEFINNLVPDMQDYHIAYDIKGSARSGYLCAYKSGVTEFKKKYNPKKTVVKESNSYTNTADLIYQNLKNGEKTLLKDIKISQKSTRFEMADEVIKDINKLINSGVKANEIAVITPLIDDVLINTLKEKAVNIKFQMLSGSEKLSDCDDIKYIITILKAVNDIKLKDYEIKNVLINLLNIPLKNYTLRDNDFDNIEFINEGYENKYIKLQSIIKSLKKTKPQVSEQIKIIYNNLIKEFKSNTDTKKYEFLVKEAQSFETAFSGENIAKEFILQIENSIISENPTEGIKINKDSVIVATAQKITDYSLQTKYQLWLDTSNSEWFKEDTGTLYNSWVLNRDWTKNEYTLEDNIALTREKTASVLRKLMLCAKKEIWLYSSIYDNNGNENFSGLNEYIYTDIKEEKKEYKIIPRDDQKAVLEYKSGKMGIMAVPGAGKTTILLALIIKLMKESIKGSNIFVLTYMESAAKNFKERIQNALGQTAELPNISTIHGLALRIIKENANYTKAGLDENFQICDDIQKEKIVKELLNTNKINEDNFENYLRCISIVKLSQNNENITSKYKEIKEFFNFYKEYNNYLKRNNLIDYDDMLYYAVKILKENKDILSSYQEICRYIIEDEAQDSTQIQQVLLNLLSGKHKNIVRCGDINQAITSTFTNSDTEGFKEFIRTNKKVEMSSSQRCSVPIYTYANELVKKSLQKEELKPAFYDIQIKGTKNNPDNKKPPEYLIFETEKDEKQFIVNKIKSIKKDDPNASIGVLLRLNSQVNEYNELLLANDIKTSVRTDTMGQKRIYKCIYSVLKLLENPVNKENIINLAQNYTNLITKEDIEYIKSTKIPFINLNPDELQTEGLNQLYWDIEYWLNNSTESIEITALKAGLYYSKTEIERANTYIISTYIKKLSDNTDSAQSIINQLEYSANKPMSMYKFFEEEKDNSEVEIMTAHKSKGDEFDYVFIAQMNEDNYPLEIENVKIKNSGHFTETIKALVNRTKIKTPDEIKQEQLYETLRLLYVAITRAKSELYITSAKAYKRNKKTKLSNFINNFSQSNVI